MDTPLAVTALAALAQPSRLALFRRLVELGPDGAVPGELAAALAIAPATLSFHLRTLVQAGLIEAEPRGRHIHYRANFVRMAALVDFLTDHCCGGEPSRCLPARGRARPAASKAASARTRSACGASAEAAQQQASRTRRTR